MRCWPPAPCITGWCETGLRCKCNLLVETGTRARFASLRLPDRLRRDRGLSVHGLPDAVRDDAQGPGEARLARSAASSAAATGTASARACTRSCRRWASRRSPATAARSCSRSSDCRARSWICASVTPPAASRARTSTISRATRKYLAMRAWNPRVGRRAGRHLQVRARRRVPHVQPRRGRGAAGGRGLGRLRAATSCMRGW